MAVLPINDIDIYYRETGSGPPLILLMGFTANSDWWPPEFVQAVARHFRVICIDNRGAGRTPNGKKRFTIRQAATDTIAFMDALNLAKAHIFGISMGGMIAQELAATFGNRIDRLILGCTMARPMTGFFSGLPGQARLLSRYVYDRHVRERPWVVNIMFSPDFLRSNPHITGEFTEMAAQARIKPRAWIHQLLAILSFNAFPRLGSIHHRTLVMAGSGDLLIASKQSGHIAGRLPNARLLMLSGLGHAFVGEAPETIAQEVVSFLSNKGNT